MLAFIATLSVNADSVDAFKTAMAEVIPKVRQEPGNQAYIGHQSPGRADKIRVLRAV